MQARKNITLLACLLVAGCETATSSGTGPSLLSLIEANKPWEEGYDQTFQDDTHCLRDKAFYQAVGQTRNISEAGVVFNNIGKPASREDDEFRAASEIFRGNTIPWETSSYVHFFFAKCVSTFGR